MPRIAGHLPVLLRSRYLGFRVVIGRRYISEDKSSEITAWMGDLKDLRKSEEDSIDVMRVHQLFMTLPSRDGSMGDPVVKPRMGDALPSGHHLILFPPVTPVHQLHDDGTDSTYDAPPYFTRRMWAGGSFEFNSRNPLKIGEDVRCETTISNVKKKGSGFVFVEQLKQISNSLGVAVTERRTHVFLPPPIKDPRPVSKIVKLFDPKYSHFSLTFVPTPAMLFRFSAVTFNAHMIHLDPEFSRNVDGYPERLVHGPLTAMMLLELMTKHTPPSHTISTYSYRALNPLLVGNSIALHGTWSPAKLAARLTAVDHLGQVCMTGDIQLETPPPGVEK